MTNMLKSIKQHNDKLNKVKLDLAKEKEKATKKAIYTHLNKGNKYVDWDYVKNLKDRIDSGYHKTSK